MAVKGSVVCGGDQLTTRLAVQNGSLYSLFALSSAPEVMWSIMASFMLYVVDKYARDFYMENANF